MEVLVTLRQILMRRLLSGQILMKEVGIDSGRSVEEGFPGEVRRNVLYDGFTEIS